MSRLTIRTKEDLIKRYHEQVLLFPLMARDISLKRYLQVNLPTVLMSVRNETKRGAK